MNIELSSKKKSTLEKRHRHCSDGRERDRIKAVLLFSEGWSLNQIAQALRWHETTIARHIEDYKAGKLTVDSGGSKSYLTAEQREALVAHLTEHTYHCNHEIVAYIKQTYAIDFTVAGLHKWLHRNGFSYKKPKGHPHKADKEAQEKFIEDYKALKSSVPSDEPIIFMDSVHPSQATKLSHGWIKKGADKLVKTSASRTRLNIVGGIQLGRLSQPVVAQYDRVNGEAIADFMQQLRAQYSEAKTLHLILDGAGYHKAKIVLDQAEALSIKLHYLPPYSPNLNPIERLWKVMNEKVRNNRFFRSPTEFKQSIERFFQHILPDIADTLNDRINDNFQTLFPAI